MAGYRIMTAMQSSRAPAYVVVKSFAVGRISLRQHQKGPPVRYIVDIEPANSGPGCGTIIFWGLVILVAIAMCSS